MEPPKEKNNTFFQTILFDAVLALYAFIIHNLVIGDKNIAATFPLALLIAIMLGVQLVIPTAIAWLYTLKHPPDPYSLESETGGMELLTLYVTVALYLAGLLFAAYTQKAAGAWILPFFLLGGGILCFIAWAHAFSLFRTKEKLLRGLALFLPLLQKSATSPKGRLAMVALIVLLLSFWGDITVHALRSQGYKGPGAIIIMVVSGVLPVRVLLMSPSIKNRLGTAIGVASFCFYLYSLWTL
ncbi:hypothetical protein KKF84_17300 [Myxococcota bacterium]|nr:hypothetical protein [Myxococcota bacterium]MBU1537084.1 hypothetical protein [Myxococcota bacterium]